MPARERDGQRPLSLSAKRITAAHLKLLREEPHEEYWRPRTRGDCANIERPCPYVSCKYHLYIDVSRTGTLKLNFPHLEPDELEETCALDVAERPREVTYEEIGLLMNVTRERARQLAEMALEQMESEQVLAEVYVEAAGA